MADGDWFSRTWNPVVGCSPASRGCDNCWAARFSHRGLCPQHRGLTERLNDGSIRFTGRTRVVPAAYSNPWLWRSPQIVLLPSMGDLLHESVSDAAIGEVLSVVEQTRRHTYVWLTKRPERYRSVLRDREPLPNLLIGTSIEDAAVKGRLDPLVEMAWRGWRTAVSFEPLLGLVQTAPRMLDGAWVIVGGESGPGARPCEYEWIRQVIEDARFVGAPVWVKQLGGHPDRRGDPATWPPFLRVRERPA